MKPRDSSETASPAGSQEPANPSSPGKTDTLTPYSLADLDRMLALWQDSSTPKRDEYIQKLRKALVEDA